MASGTVVLVVVVPTNDTVEEEVLHKLASLFPSMQFCISMLYTVEQFSGSKLFAQAAQKYVSETYGYEVQLLWTFFPLVERCLTQKQLYAAPTPVQPPAPLPFHEIEKSGPLILETAQPVELKAPPPAPRPRKLAVPRSRAPRPQPTVVVEPKPSEVLSTQQDELLDVDAFNTFFADFDMTDLDGVQPEPTNDLEKILKDEVSDVLLEATSPATPTTPLLDSGFNSDSGSPESIADCPFLMTNCRRSYVRSAEDDVIPPKLIRLG
ncbi:unnamed protein product [Caenorhabditis auriculariae]|uniref:Uncharacterized protein n=1 Tax=Caenorhabditis auriculariae TaxID=2777116 RepID=A0A8S1HRM3_9PELO|nr:unnamed protein product [Caenorhabditis auriculariae]